MRNSSGQHEVLCDNCSRDLTKVIRRMCTVQDVTLHARFLHLPVLITTPGTADPPWAQHGTSLLLFFRHLHILVEGTLLITIMKGGCMARSWRCNHRRHLQIKVGQQVVLDMLLGLGQVAEVARLWAKLRMCSNTVLVPIVIELVQIAGTQEEVLLGCCVVIHIGNSAFVTKPCFLHRDVKIGHLVIDFRPLAHLSTSYVLILIEACLHVKQRNWGHLSVDNGICWSNLLLVKHLCRLIGELFNC